MLTPHLIPVGGYATKKGLLLVKCCAVQFAVQYSLKLQRTSAAKSYKKRLSFATSRIS
jgi:hypothetical protein